VAGSYRRVAAPAALEGQRAGQSEEQESDGAHVRAILRQIVLVVQNIALGSGGRWTRRSAAIPATRLRKFRTPICKRLPLFVI
jgi:hypothetical protein